MPTETICASEPALTQVLERSVRDRTGGRIQRLTVEASGGRLTVRGQAPSYYVKQLAIQAVLETLGPRRPETVELAIHVG